MKRLRASAGFTLTELMAVVAVLSVIAALAAPNLGSFLAGQRLKTLSYDLTSDLLLARSEALKRNDADVTVNPSSQGWAGGWTVSRGGTMLSQRTGLAAAGVTLTGAPAGIVFRAGSGRAQADVRMTLTSATAGSGAARCIELDLSGRARAARGACS